MPLYWTIDSKERLFTGVGEGEVTLADAMSLLEALAGAKALPYRKLFDGRAIQSTMTGEELLIRSALPAELLGWTFSCHTGEWACGQCRGCTKHNALKGLPTGVA